MSQLTTPNAGGLAALQSLRQGLAQVRSTVSAAVGGTPLLRLLKDGHWVMGAEDTLIAAGTEALLNPSSLMSGYSCWTNRAPGQGKNELLGEEMWGIMSPKPPASTLPVHHDPRTQEVCQWRDVMSIDVVFLNGPHKKQQVMYKASSVGGLRVLSSIMDAVMTRIDTGATHVFPIVALSSDSYNHQSYGRTYVPVMEIVGWANAAGEEDGDDAGEPVAVDTKVKAAVESEPEPVAAAEPPAGRRRRI